VQQSVRAAAIQLAVVIFFAMAVAGWLCGSSPGACGLRALGGAVVMYVVTQIAGRIVIKILLDAIVDSQIRKQTDRTNE